MFSNFQKILYNKFTDEQVVEFVIRHIRSSCYGDAFSSRYHSFKNTANKLALADFLLYLYTDRRGFDIKPTLKRYFTKDGYQGMILAYRTAKQEYDNERQRSIDCSKKMQS